MNWLLKEEPTHYGFDALMKDRKAVWSGVRNALAHVAVDVAPVKKLPRPVTLAAIKADAAFKDFPLVRIARLSVMPVTDAEWARIERMAGNAGR
jgi:predicted RNA-binding protein with PUA-like domain